jgi:hypothetical protein
VNLLILSHEAEDLSMNAAVFLQKTQDMEEYTLNNS